MSNIKPATGAFAWPTIDVDPADIPELTSKMLNCDYKLGAKAPSLDVQLKDVKKIDCSGFTRLILYKASGVVMPDGSWGQMDWANKQGFKHSDVTAGTLRDGALRLAVLPQQPGKGVGRHVLFVLNGRTYESFGGHGPGSRVWTGRGYQGKCKLWVLTPPVK